ncbi:hypothetical protein HOL63_03900 [Candidatus Peregrinibacteria bacterium]|jgi:hypothetical protein|nr:hypothetical protein [Candidatus Peregrinibacteria bacterium]
MSKFPLIIGAFSLSLITVIVMVMDSNSHSPSTDLFEGMHLSAPIPEDIPEEIPDDDARFAPYVRYQSDTHGYALSYPSTWTLDDSKKDFGGDILSDPSEHSIITISETKDESLMTTDAVEMLTQSIRESLNLDAAFTLETLQQLMWKGRHTIFTNGVRHLGSRTLHTREYNIFRPNHGGVLNISITTQDSSEALHKEVIESILNSLDVCPKK